MSDPTLPPNQREFHCQHCHGKIRIPKDLPPTTGPCPHCQGTITSPPPVAEYPPVPAPMFVPPSPVAPPEPPGQSRGTILSEPIPSPEKEAESVAEEIPAPATETTGPPAAERSEALPAKRKAAPPEPKPSPAKILLPILTLVILLAAFAAAAGYFVYREMTDRSAVKPANVARAGGDPALSESQYLRIGWQRDAYTVLEKFLAAKTVDEKLPYILNGRNLKSQMDSFYGGSVINDADTPADAFSVFELSESDHKRGIFMMVFDQPPQFDIKDFFRPLANLEVQYGLDEADILLSTLARVGNFATEPVRVNALFKRTPEGLKLDWETFAQTKYKTFQTLVELPEPGQSGVFRVIISEDVPDAGKPLPAGMKTYRVSDPASPEMSARVNVNLDSALGRLLAEINWRGQQNRPINRTATVELKWTSGDKPELQISRFICWEFLHLGGEEKPAAGAPAKR